MRDRYLNMPFNGLAVPAALLVWVTFAAENAAAQEADPPAPTAPDRSRVLYVDIPVPFEPGTDPEMPAPPRPAIPEDDPQYQVQVANLSDYSQSVAETEFNGVVWDQGLVEDLTALGQLQQDLGNHPEAVQIFDRAMHVSRINEGLHALDQIPVVEMMIDSYRALADWQQVDLYENYLYYIQQKAYGSSDPRLIPVLDQLGQWNIEAFTIGHGEPLGLRLSTAQILFSAAVRMVGIHFDKDDRVVSFSRNLARTAYLDKQYPEYVTELDRPEYRSAQDRMRDLYQGRRANSARGYRVGAEALTEVIRFYEQSSDDPYLLAEAIADLADWELIFDRRQLGLDLYAEAWAVLADQPDSEELQQRLFGQVLSVPTFAELPTNLLMGSTDSQERPGLRYDYADVVLDLTQYGAPRNVMVISEETEDNARQLDQLRRVVRSMTFRPLIVDGQAQDSEGHHFRYRYWY